MKRNVKALVIVLMMVLMLVAVNGVALAGIVNWRGFGW